MMKVTDEPNGNERSERLRFVKYRVTQKKRELSKNPTKIEEIQEKKLLTEIELLQLAF
jgi:hypothetical protein